MTLVTIKNEDARSHFRDNLEDVYANRWEIWQDLILKIAERARREMDAGEYVTQDEVDVGLHERGVL